MVTDRLVHPSTRAVVVAINAAGASSETLETAALLAASEGADLEVILVENANLLRLADLPVTREIDRVSGEIREIDSHRMLRALEIEARHLRQKVAHIGRMRAVRSTLRIARGEILAEALSASARVDVTFVHAGAHAFPGEGLAIRGARSRTAPAGRGAARAAHRKRVWSLYEGGAGSVRALETATKLARALSCGLMVLIPYRTAGEAETRAHEVRTHSGNIEIRFLESSTNRSPLESHMLEPRGSRLLVVATQSPSLEDAATRRYLESLPVPLVLVT